MITETIKTLKSDTEWAELRDYYLALTFLFDMVDTELSSEFNITIGNQILLTKKMMDFLKVRPGMELLSIRSSDIAFTMGAKGPLLEKAKISHALCHIVSVYFLEVCQATWHL